MNDLSNLSAEVIVLGTKVRVPIYQSGPASAWAGIRGGAVPEAHIVHTAGGIAIDAKAARQLAAQARAALEVLGIPLRT
jgi:hypothetical protein